MPGGTLDWIKSHGGALAISGIGASVVAARVLAVGGYDTQSAYYVLNAQGTGTVVLGTLLPILTVLPIFIGGAILGLVLMSPRKGDEESVNRYHRRVVVGFLLLLAAFGPWPIALVVFGVIGLFTLLWVLGLRLRVGPRMDRWLGIAMGCLLVLVAAAVVLSPRPWITEEVVQPVHGRAVVGYVLTRDGNELVVLENEPRQVIRVPEEGISRRVCTPRTDGFAAFLDDVFTAPPALALPGRPKSADYESCPLDEDDDAKMK